MISGNERDSRGVENVYGKIAGPVLYQFGAGEKVSIIRKRGVAYLERQVAYYFSNAVHNYHDMGG